MSIAAYQDHGSFMPERIIARLMTTQAEMASTLGLGRDAIARKDRVRSPKTQRRIREMVEIINRVEPRFGTPAIAYAWYRSEPLAGFSGLTAMQLVQDGHADWVHDYLTEIEHGLPA